MQCFKLLWWLQLVQAAMAAVSCRCCSAAVSVCGMVSGCEAVAASCSLAAGVVLQAAVAVFAVGCSGFGEAVASVLQYCSSGETVLV